MNWSGIAEKSTIAPFYPSSQDYNFELRDPNALLDTAANSKMYAQILLKDDIQNYFNGFYYDCDIRTRVRMASRTSIMYTAKEDVDKAKTCIKG